MSRLAIRSSLLHFLADPDQVGEESCYEYLHDGLLLIEDGHVRGMGPASELLPDQPAGTKIVEYPGHLVMPGFVDTHIHYPQIDVIASHGEQLLDWLKYCIFPAEQKFADPTYSRQRAELFLDELLRAGTTTAMVFGTVHKQSVEAFFAASASRGLRMIAGKVMMDRHAPPGLTDTAETSYVDSRELIRRWHGRNRLDYAVTPRFAGTSSREQLQRAGQILQEFPGVYLQTHLSENIEEVAWVGELFPDAEHYLHTYDNAGLLGRRSVFAHGIHLSDTEWCRLVETRSNIAFCPTSNLFLGSGLFRMSHAIREQLCVGMGTDIGAGTSFSMLQTLNEAYKVMKLQGDQLSPLKAFYLATLGGATALDLQRSIGNFEAGKEADIVVLDPAATPLMSLRQQACTGLEQQLFLLMMLGDDRAVKACYALGKPVHQRDTAPL